MGMDLIQFRLSSASAKSVKHDVTGSNSSEVAQSHELACVSVSGSLRALSGLSGDAGLRVVDKDYCTKCSGYDGFRCAVYVAGQCGVCGMCKHCAEVFICPNTVPPPVPPHVGERYIRVPMIKRTFVRVGRKAPLNGGGLGVNIVRVADASAAAGARLNLMACALLALSGIARWQQRAAQKSFKISDGRTLSAKDVVLGIPDDFDIASFVPAQARDFMLQVLVTARAVAKGTPLPESEGDLRACEALLCACLAWDPASSTQSAFNRRFVQPVLDALQADRDAHTVDLQLAARRTLCVLLEEALPEVATALRVSEQMRLAGQTVDADAADSRLLDLLEAVVRDVQLDVSAEDAGPVPPYNALWFASAANPLNGGLVSPGLELSRGRESQLRVWKGADRRGGGADGDSDKEDGVCRHKMLKEGIKNIGGMINCVCACGKVLASGMCKGAEGRVHVCC